MTQMCFVCVHAFRTKEPGFPPPREKEQEEKVFVVVEGLTQATNESFILKTPNLSKSKLIIGNYVN